ncbi:hypothetical protein [Pontibacter harenae]|uniref:hypothetical protein n=1 Tax=Pontibacter harenae TaxID=2894083 RepID=UPI001E5A0FF6|nr:hypothetical protein [Pontibacter harenae]MCC9167129.1 hypothetical protein [Pontibacter harenae]
MRLKSPPFLLLCVFWLFSPSVQAQTAEPDTSFIQSSVSAAVNSYREAVGLNAHLYNGPEYVTETISYLEGHQFFKEKIPTSGAVLYDGTWFNNVPMLYDVVIDELAIFHPGNGILQRLIKEKVQMFTLQDHLFVFIKSDSISANSVIKPGLHDLLYKGEVQVLAKRDKDIQERATSKGMEGAYEVMDKYYLYKDGAYHQVKSKSSVLKVLRDEKKQLQKFARAQKLKFRRNREEALVQVAAHYDALKTQNLDR